MNRPKLHSIPLAEVRLIPGVVIITMSVGQWDALLAEAYRRGHTLLELDENERPIGAYRQCNCELCQARKN